MEQLLQICGGNVVDLLTNTPRYVEEMLLICGGNVVSVIIIISIYPQVLASYQHSYPQINIHRYIHRCE